MLGNRASSVEKYLKNSLADLQLSYIDLYLIHVPFCMPDTDGDFHRHENGDIVLDTAINHVDTWKVRLITNHRSINHSNLNTSRYYIVHCFVFFFTIRLWKNSFRLD